MSKIRLGSQLFINRNDSVSQIRSWVYDMSQQGFSLIRLFMSWDLLEHQEGEWDFEQFDAVFNSAQEHGLEIVPTLMSVSPPGWMRCTRGMQDVGDLDDPIYWKKSLHYIQTVVSRYAEHPALDSWIIWNEPSRTLSTTNSNTLIHFRDFLRNKYQNNIQLLNQQYFQQFNNFEHILQGAQASSSSLEFKSHSEDIDWLEYTCAALSDKLRIIGALTKQIDPKHKIHINPHRISQCMSEGGQDIWQQAKLCDFIGSSVHPPWHSVRFPKDRIQQSVAMFADMMRSATPDPDHLFWVTELQGGPTIFSAFEPSGPLPSEIRSWIWESAASGAQAVLFWCYNNRDDGFEAGEWGLVQDNGKASKRLQAITQTHHELQHEQHLLDQCSPHRGEIGILVSSSSWNLGLLEGEGEDPKNLRNKQMASDAVCGAYCLAQDLGFELRFVHESELANQQYFDLAAILIPSCTALDENSLGHLHDYCNQGGHIIADGLCGWKLPNGRIARHRHQALHDLFGASVGEIYGASTSTCQYKSLTLKPNLMQINFEDNSSCVARWSDDSPALIRKQHAETGSATRLGTIFFQAYFTNPQAQSRQLLSQLLPAQIQPSASIAYIDQSLRMRRLQHPDGEVCIIMNNGDSRTLALNIANNTAILDQSGTVLGCTALNLDKNEVRVLLLQKHQHLESVQKIG